MNSTHRSGNHYSPANHSADIDDESYGRDVSEEKMELRELIKNWNNAAIYAINRRSIIALTELQDQMKRELTCKMYYEPEHNELLSPMYGVAYALESAIERFHTSDQDQDRKWYSLEEAFNQAKRGCEYLF